MQSQDEMEVAVVEEEESPEGMPSLHVEFLVVSRDLKALEGAANRLQSRVRYSKRGIANSTLVEMRVDNVSQEQFETVLEGFTQSLPRALRVLGGVQGVRALDAAEVRVTIFSNSNLNAGTYLPPQLLEIVRSFELALYFDAM